MINWSIDYSKPNANYHKLFVDVKLMEACIDSYDEFQLYLNVVEFGKGDNNDPFPIGLKSYISQQYYQLEPEWFE